MQLSATLLTLATAVAAVAAAATPVPAPAGVLPAPKEAICHGQRGYIAFPAFGDGPDVAWKIGTQQLAVYCAVNGFEYPPRRVSAYLSNGVDGLTDGGVVLSPLPGLPAADAAKNPEITLAKYLAYPLNFTVPASFGGPGRKQLVFIEEYKDTATGDFTPFVYRSRKFIVN